MRLARTPLLAATFLLLPLTLALAPRADRVSFEPAEGSSVTRQLDFELAMGIDDLRILVQGQEMPVPMDELGDGLVVELALRVVDQFVAATEGRVVELVRTYESIRIEGGPRGETESMDEADELVDKPVRFRWDADDEEYDVTYAEDDNRGDLELLEGLHPDMDFTMLLPRREVSVGDSWTVGGKELAWLFAPGGFPMPEGDDDMQLGDLFETTVEPQLEQAFRDFEVTCTYTANREQDGQQVGEISFSFRNSASIELTELLEAAAEQSLREVEVPISFDIEARVELELDGSGTLLWNLAAQRAHAFDMLSDIMIQLEANAEMHVQDDTQSFEADLEMSGNGNWKMTTE